MNRYFGLKRATTLDHRELPVLRYPSGTPALRKFSISRSRPLRKTGLSLCAAAR
jgi:hypothetical protein